MTSRRKSKTQKTNRSKSPRTQAEDITKGKTKPHHIGKHTSETLTQELFSLNNTKPMFRDSKWIVKYNSIMSKIRNIEDPNVKRKVNSKAKAMLLTNEV